MCRISIYFVLLFFIACQSDDSLLEGDYILSPESSMGVSVTTTPTTKGELVTKPAEMGSLGLYCAWTGVEIWKSSTSFSKLFNRQFTVSSEGDWSIVGNAEPWGYESTDDNYTFFAYSPYYEKTDIVTTDIVNGELIIKYIAPLSSLNQPDLMIAEPLKDINVQIAGVPLTFYHALASISFSIISTSGVRIEKIDVTGVVGEGTLQWDYDTNKLKWSYDGLSSNTYSVDVDEEYTLGTDYSAQVSTEKGSLMMIPQLLTDSAKITLSLDNDETVSFEIPTDTVWEAGKQYEYIARLGDDECDYLFTASQISNCYIINPTEDNETIVQIPIEDRINDFWKNYSSDGTKKIRNANTPDQYSAFVVWQDFDCDVSVKYKIFDDADEKMAIRLYITTAKHDGNLVFAVEGSDDDGDIITLWSWHLWFTDYNPDAIADANYSKIEVGVEGEYDLDGYSGYVHRYMDKAKTSSVWNGMYSDKFIMDRNIGERSSYSEDYGAGAVYYQFGRKDPFPGKAATYYTGETEPVKLDRSGYDYSYSVIHSQDFFIIPTSAVKNWCEVYATRSYSCLWFDSALLTSVSYEGKSIFDPSPLGWRVPVIDTWNGFSTDNSSCTFAKYNYYGYRDYYDGSLEQADCSAYVWSANPEGYDTAYCFSTTESTATLSDIMIMVYGLPVRAIQE